MVKWVHYLVIVLMLCVSTQALSVVFDSHATHQNSEYHFSDIAHEEQSDAFPAPEESGASTSGLDCQHCCHCHGAQHIFLPWLIKALPVAGQYHIQQSLTLPPADGYWRNLLRPPIV